MRRSTFGSCALSFVVLLASTHLACRGSSVPAHGRAANFLERTVDLEDQFNAEADPFGLVPFGCVRELVFGLTKDAEKPHARSSRFKIRARASGQSAAASPRLFKASTRRSNFASHAASQSASCGPSTLARISDASSRRSASGSAWTSSKSRRAEPVIAAV